MKLLTNLILTALLTPMAFADAFSERLMDEITQSDLLEDFWAGDDGEPCHEPTVVITGLDTRASTVSIVVHQNGSAIGCYEQSWECVVEYQKEGDSLILITDSATMECKSL